MLALTDLVARLQEDCPAEAGVPSEAQYERAVKSAVIDFGERAGRSKQGTLNITAGTATYDLPEDFLKLIRLSSLYAPDGILNSPAGLIPVGTGFCEEILVNGLTITFSPTPQYTLAREYRYKAGWALNVDSENGEYYEELTERHAKIVMLLAQSLATKSKSNAAGGGMSYRQGDVSVDTTANARNLELQADALKADYLAAVEAYVGTVLVMG